MRFSASQLRADFVNFFNRTQIGNPVAANPLAKPLQDGLGRYNGGFGVINDTAAIGAAPSISSNGTVGQWFQQPGNGT